MLTKYIQYYAGLTPKTWIGILACVMEATLVGIFSFMTVYFTSVLQISIIDAGKIMACYGAGTILGAMLGGRLADQFKPRLIAALCLMTQALCYLSLARLQHTHEFMLVMFLSGIASYGFITSNHTWTLGVTSPQMRLKAINILDAASNLGFGLAGAIISFIALRSFPLIFTCSGVMLIFTAVFIISCRFKETQQSHEEGFYQPDSHTQSSLSPLLILALVFAGGVMVSQYSSTYSLYLRELFPDMENKSFGILFILNAWIVVLFQTPIMSYLAEFRKITLVSVGLFLLGFGLWMLNIAYTYDIAIIACIIMTIGEIMFFSTAQLICYEQGDHDKKGQSIGHFRMALAASRIVGPIFGTTVYDLQGGGNLFLIFLLIGMTSLLIPISLRYTHAAPQKLRINR
jgi:predicted MFS family arabinose efflux permease